jgi:outer membrane protein assembly factor BamB
VRHAKIRALGLALMAGAAGAALASSGRPGTAAPVAAGAGDWPMYGHDTARTNANPAETQLTAGNVAGLAQRWQINIGSNGTDPSGAPSVANGRVYVGSSAPSGPNFFAFDAASGARVWSAQIGYQQSCFNVGIGATPAVAGDVVVAGGGDGAYYGLNAATGARLWRHALDVGPSGFAWASPLVAGERAYVGVASRCDNPSVRGEVRALDLRSGAVLARQAFVPAGKAGAGIWNSPALSPDGKTLAVATGEDYAGYDGPNNRAMVALDPGTLAIRAASPEGASRGDLDFGATPVIFHDRRGRTLAGATHKNGTFYAFDLGAIGAGPVWTRDTSVTVGAMPAYDAGWGDGGTLFLLGRDGQLFAVDPASGADRWAPAHLGVTRGNIAIANRMIFSNSAGAVRVLDETTGKSLATLTPQHAGTANSGVVVSNGFVYWLSGSYINAWSLPAAAPAATPAATGTPGGGPGFADAAFARLWERDDRLVAAHLAPRSWMWGPAPISPGLTEAYQEGPSGIRVVQYFDKSRMEINNPAGDQSKPFFVTNGLLVVELIGGRLQIGDSAYETRPGANINVAGDSDDPSAPSYISLQGVANTPLGDHKAPDRTGQRATATLARDGSVGDNPGKAAVPGVDFAHFEAGVGHNVPRVFWDYLNSRGPVLENGQTTQAALSDPWFYASGLPISEPYWATVKIAGKPADVLLQAFERRVLTYNPANAAPFQVEMGNVGRHYYDWRYGAGH